ncbi:ABC transporter permease [Gynuella sunshinyii]|uniref:ABC-type antimicrobial peptide transport system, permease component n=1 Tax=Gynuella sunshinyii YC6258 TaxID=1445510 RepID=A0A0C5W5J7_9GAMM|nr:ABC transporter permease [Gynuella sunshinyii]AJQ97874.1 ABC-type antimicrobial peptide transport system, permease component [Gynuella sunshinyii YC6258]
MMVLPLKQVFQEMAAEKLSLLLTILAVAWSALSIATVLAIGEGLRQGIIRTSSSGNGNLIYLSGGYAQHSHGAVIEGTRLKLQPEDVELIRALPDVDHAEVTAVWNKRVRYEDRRAWQTPIAVSPGYQRLTGLKVLPGGRWFNPLDQAERRKVIILGYSAAVGLFNATRRWSWVDAAKLEIDPVGLQVKVGEEDFTVIGVLSKSSALLEQGVPADYSVFMPFATWQQFNPGEPVSAVDILPATGASRERVASTARQVIGRKYGAAVDDPQFVQIKDILLEQKTMRRFLLGLQAFLGIIGLITLTVAGIGIANVMFAAVRRSTRDIGVRMAVGATPTAIRIHYFVQALLTMAIGGGLGLLLTMTVIAGIRHLPLDGNMLFNELGQPMPELSWPIVSLVILALALVGMAAAWFPASKAAGVMPLAALQSE